MSQGGPSRTHGDGFRCSRRGFARYCAMPTAMTLGRPTSRLNGSGLAILAPAAQRDRSAYSARCSPAGWPSQGGPHSKRERRNAMTSAPNIEVEAFKNFEREGYSTIAEGYASATAAVTSQANQAILDAVVARPGVSLLDIACGPGWLSAAAAQRGAVVSALDFAENMVLLARLRCPDADVRNADAE